MEVRTVQASITDIECDTLVVNLFQGVADTAGAAGAVDRALGGLLTDLIRQERFEGKAGQTLLVHTHGKLPAKRVIVAGLGEKDRFDLNAVRKASAAALRRAKECCSDSSATIVHGAGQGSLGIERAAQATVEGALIGIYEFLKYKSEPAGHSIGELVVVEADESKIEAASWGSERGRVVAEAVNAARDLVNSPSNDITPTFLADYALQMASETGLQCSVLEREDADGLGMGAYLAVARGSAERPKFIVLSYSPEQTSQKTVAIVGKGVTFDSGGLSIKPADSMTTMKDDMSGAAAVLATMRAVARIRPSLNVMAIVPATENMPDGSAVKPGDVVRAMNGKTIEVENTDAEGRLTLADALCYAVKNGADELVDLATLTGACVVALGRGMSGVFTNSDELLSRMMVCSEISGDALWQLPLCDDYRKQIDSQIADMKNTGGREAGAITAALLIREFAGGRPWAHIDIAGPAFLNEDNGLLGKGGTGAGVRLLVEYLCGGPEFRIRP